MENTEESNLEIIPAVFFDIDDKISNENISSLNIDDSGASPISDNNEKFPSKISNTAAEIHTSIQDDLSQKTPTKDSPANESAETNAENEDNVNCSSHIQDKNLSMINDLSPPNVETEQKGSESKKAPPERKNKKNEAKKFNFKNKFSIKTLPSIFQGSIKKHNNEYEKNKQDAQYVEPAEHNLSKKESEEGIKILYARSSTKFSSKSKKSKWRKKFENSPFSGFGQNIHYLNKKQSTKPIFQHKKIIKKDYSKRKFKTYAHEADPDKFIQQINTTIQKGKSDLSATIINDFHHAYRVKPQLREKEDINKIKYSQMDCTSKDDNLFHIQTLATDKFKTKINKKTLSTPWFQYENQQMKMKDSLSKSNVPTQKQTLPRESKKRRSRHRSTLLRSQINSHIEQHRGLKDRSTTNSDSQIRSPYVQNHISELLELKRNKHDEVALDSDPLKNDLRQRSKWFMRSKYNVSSSVEPVSQKIHTKASELSKSRKNLAKGYRVYKNVSSSFTDQRNIHRKNKKDKITHAVKIYNTELDHGDKTSKSKIRNSLSQNKIRQKISPNYDITLKTTSRQKKRSKSCLPPSNYAFTKEDEMHSKDHLPSLKQRIGNLMYFRPKKITSVDQALQMKRSQLFGMQNTICNGSGKEFRNINSFSNKSFHNIINSKTKLKKRSTLLRFCLPENETIQKDMYFDKEDDSKYNEDIRGNEANQRYEYRYKNKCNNSENYNEKQVVKKKGEKNNKVKRKNCSELKDTRFSPKDSKSKPVVTVYNCRLRTNIKQQRRSTSSSTKILPGSAKYMQTKKRACGNVVDEREIGDVEKDIRQPKQSFNGVSRKCVKNLYSNGKERNPSDTKLPECVFENGKNLKYDYRIRPKCPNQKISIIGKGNNKVKSAGITHFMRGTDNIHAIQVKNRKRLLAGKVKFDVYQMHVQKNRNGQKISSTVLPQKDEEINSYFLENGPLPTRFYNSDLVNQNSSHVSNTVKYVQKRVKLGDLKMRVKDSKRHDFIVNAVNDSHKFVNNLKDNDAIKECKPKIEIQQEFFPEETKNKYLKKDTSSVIFDLIQRKNRSKIDSRGCTKQSKRSNKAKDREELSNLTNKTMKSVKKESSFINFANQNSVYIQRKIDGFRFKQIQTHKKKNKKHKCPFYKTLRRLPTNEDCECSNPSFEFASYDSSPVHSSASTSPVHSSASTSPQHSSGSSSPENTPVSTSPKNTSASTSPENTLANTLPENALANRSQESISPKPLTESISPGTGKPGFSKLLKKIKIDSIFKKLTNKICNNKTNDKSKSDLLPFVDLKSGQKDDSEKTSEEISEKPKTISEREELVKTEPYEWDCAKKCEKICNVPLSEYPDKIEHHEELSEKVSEEPKSKSKRKKSPKPNDNEEISKKSSKEPKPKSKHKKSAKSDDSEELSKKPSKEPKIKSKFKKSAKSDESEEISEKSSKEPKPKYKLKKSAKSDKSKEDVHKDEDDSELILKKTKSKRRMSPKHERYGEDWDTPEKIAKQPKIESKRKKSSKLEQYKKVKADTPGKISKESEAELKRKKSPKLEQYKKIKPDTSEKISKDLKPRLKHKKPPKLEQYKKVEADITEEISKESKAKSKRKKSPKSDDSEEMLEKTKSKRKKSPKSDDSEEMLEKTKSKRKKSTKSDDSEEMLEKTKSKRKKSPKSDDSEEMLEKTKSKRKKSPKSDDSEEMLEKTKSKGKKPAKSKKHSEDSAEMSENISKGPKSKSKRKKSPKSDESEEILEKTKSKGEKSAKSKKYSEDSAEMSEKTHKVSKSKKNAKLKHEEESEEISKKSKEPKSKSKLKKSDKSKEDMSKDKKDSEEISKSKKSPKSKMEKEKRKEPKKDKGKGDSAEMSEKLKGPKSKSKRKKSPKSDESEEIFEKTKSKGKKSAKSKKYNEDSAEMSDKTHKVSKSTKNAKSKRHKEESEEISEKSSKDPKAKSKLKRSDKSKEDISKDKKDSEEISKSKKSPKSKMEKEKRNKNKGIREPVTIKASIDKCGKRKVTMSGSNKSIKKVIKTLMSKQKQEAKKHQTKIILEDDVGIENCNKKNQVAPNEYEIIDTPENIGTLLKSMKSGSTNEFYKVNEGESTEEIENKGKKRNKNKNKKSSKKSDLPQGKSFKRVQICGPEKDVKKILKLIKAKGLKGNELKKESYGSDSQCSMVRRKSTTISLSNSEGLGPLKFQLSGTHHEIQGIRKELELIKKLEKKSKELETKIIDNDRKQNITVSIPGANGIHLTGSRKKVYEVLSQLRHNTDIDLTNVIEINKQDCCHSKKIACGSVHDIANLIEAAAVDPDAFKTSTSFKGSQICLSLQNKFQFPFGKMFKSDRNLKFKQNWPGMALSKSKLPNTAVQLFIASSDHPEQTIFLKPTTVKTSASVNMKKFNLCVTAKIFKDGKVSCKEICVPAEGIETVTGSREGNYTKVSVKPKHLEKLKNYQFFNPRITMKSKDFQEMLKKGRKASKSLSEVCLESHDPGGVIKTIEANKQNKLKKIKNKSRKVKVDKKKHKMKAITPLSRSPDLKVIPCQDPCLQATIKPRRPSFWKSIKEASRYHIRPPQKPPAYAGGCVKHACYLMKDNIGRVCLMTLTAFLWIPLICCYQLYCCFNN